MVELRSEQVCLRLTQTERKRLERAARRKKARFSIFARDAVLKAVEEVMGK